MLTGLRNIFENKNNKKQPEPTAPGRITHSHGHGCFVHLAMFFFVVACPSIGRSEKDRERDRPPLKDVDCKRTPFILLIY